MKPGSKELGNDLPFKKAINTITKEPIRIYNQQFALVKKTKELRLIRRNDDPQIKINKA